MTDDYGGGHFNAAGGTLRLTPDQAEKALLDAVDRQLNEAEAAAPPLPGCGQAPVPSGDPGEFFD
ncbi:hypothetical protein [Desulfovibrio sp. ZJ369]|uniref:hypothetical protein n=1 Tax=Desulfovibrio sp. ZJ369 TaxID=2709793 RepID=UPI0013EE2569|nr:hypothetical protein [Desulfovibrio sp. ZJ369]